MLSLLLILALLVSVLRLVTAEAMQLHAIGCMAHGLLPYIYLQFPQKFVLQPNIRTRPLVLCLSFGIKHSGKGTN